jgi:uncharacterized protein YndB with AHSA1/START domain
VTMDATLQNRDGTWVLTLERDFAHPPEVVWPWLTDPERTGALVTDRAGPAARRTRRATGAGEPR